MEIKSVLQQMSLQEKAEFCSGADWCFTQGIEHLGVSSVLMSDGPYGLRKKAEGDYQIGDFQSKKATCFPTETTMASSWDVTLLEEIGELLGEECRHEKVSLLMGPGVNIKRHPLCGRNFEYLSEDPFLAGKLAAAYIRGLQSKKVGACLKHYACNNQETRRMSADSQVDERTLREIYLTNFEIAVKESFPVSMMCGYNKLNGTYCSENKKILTDILRDEWKYEGVVMTDWGAMNRRVCALEAGLDIEMPYSGKENTENIVRAVQSGELDEEILDTAVKRILNMVDKSLPSAEEVPLDYEAHHRKARRIASECMVLLKNDDDLLPLSVHDQKVAVLGKFAENIRYQGGGSAFVNAFRVDQILDELNIIGADITYAPGYETDEPDELLIREAVKIAAESEIVLLFAGLPETYETECYDRRDMKMPESHTQLIERVSEINSNIVVILCNGAPVEMKWKNRVKAILEAYLGGEAAAGAIVDILFGKVNPSGKLAETFPLCLEDTPAYPFYGLDEDRAIYNEGIFVGYRYYDIRKMEVAYPFGHGLSYTQFAYSDLKLDKTRIDDDQHLTVRLKVKNVGNCSGKEVVQLYVHRDRAQIPRPEMELKEFTKVFLQPGEEKELTFVLSKRSFAYYDERMKDWNVETGEYELCVGTSSRDIRLRGWVSYINKQKVPDTITRNTIIGDVYRNEKRAVLLDEMLDLYAPQVKAQYMTPDKNDLTQKRHEKMFEYMPLWVVHLFSEGSLSEDILDDYIRQMNRKDAVC